MRPGLTDLDRLSNCETDLTLITLLLCGNYGDQPDYVLQTKCINQNKSHMTNLYFC